jgi:hypothetical protein
LRTLCTRAPGTLICGVAISSRNVPRGPVDHHPNGELIRISR